VRTTLTLDPDVAAQLAAEQARTRRPFKQIVNDALRRGLARPAERPTPVGPFTEPVRLGLRSIPDIADVSEAITRAEGDTHR
jgi:hypothetical protein